MFDRDDVIAALESVVDKFGPETRYADVFKNVTGVDFDPDGGCEYASPDGQPLCIVGQVIAHLGFEFPLTWGGRLANDQARRYLHRHFHGQFSEDAVKALDCAQEAQDAGATWGYALEDARRA